MRERLNGLLAEMVEDIVSRFVWLRQFEVGGNSAGASRLLDRLEYLQALGLTATYATLSSLLVAIDISKHRHEVLIGVPGKKRRHRMTIMNTLEDFQRLSAALVSYDLRVRIGFEATGNYHWPLAHHLGQAGFELKLVSSVGLARTRGALHYSWDKNDPQDAQVRTGVQFLTP